MAMADKVYDQEDIAALSDDDLMTAWGEVGAVFETAKAQLTLFSHEHQRREAQAQLERRLGTLNDEERAALTQYVEAQSAEAGAAGMGN